MKAPSGCTSHFFSPVYRQATKSPMTSIIQPNEHQRIKNRFEACLAAAISSGLSFSSSSNVRQFFSQYRFQSFWLDSGKRWRKNITNSWACSLGKSRKPMAIFLSEVRNTSLPRKSLNGSHCAAVRSFKSIARCRKMPVFSTASSLTCN